MTPAGHQTTLDVDDTLDELSAIRDELARQELKQTTNAKKAPRGFDPAALFLLDLSYDQLYEPTTAAVDADPDYRCKGCGDVVARSKRKQHHESHRRTRDARSAPAPRVDQPTLQEEQ